jgi:hypothetical protein
MVKSATQNQKSMFSGTETPMDQAPEPANVPASRSRKPGRPFLVTLVAWMVLTITAIHLVRFVQTLSWWEFLSSLPRISPLYLASTGLIWTITGLILFIGLWQGRSWTPKTTRLLALAYALYEWLDRILASIAGREVTNWPFSAGVSALLLFLVFWTFSRRRVKAFFGEMHE